MKFLLMGISIAAVLVAGLIGFWPSTDQGAATGSEGEARPARPDRGAAKLERAVDRADSVETGSGKLSDRSAAPDSGRPSAEERIQSMLTPDQREKLAEVRQEMAARRAAGEDVPSPANPDPRALAKIREDMRTLVLTDPDGWQNHYRDVADEYLAANHPEYFASQSSGGAGGGVPQADDSDAEPPEAEPSGEGELPFDLEEAKRNREIYERSKYNLPVEEIRQERFREPE